MHAPRFERVTVLVVDDHADSRDALRQILESLGVKVLEASDGAVALTVLQRGPLPDAVLCDVRMPGLDGFAFMDRVRKDPKCARLRVVALTGLTAHHDLVRVREAGFSGYLQKPIDYDAVVATLERIFGAAPRP